MPLLNAHKTTLPESVTVHVRIRHIRHGERNKCHSCPIALAILEALRPILPDLDRVFVGRTITLWSKSREQIGVVPSPPRLIHFIREFDSRKWVKPFQFAFPLRYAIEGGFQEINTSAL